METGISATRLYGSAIAVVSGVYSIASATSGMSAEPMATAPIAWAMLAIGAVVLVHGVALLTPAADALGRRSGPLMIVWGAIMIGLQLWAVMPANGAMMAGGADTGMTAVAVLMVASGIIMIARPMTGERRG